MTETAFMKRMGARIRSELNDLKRTPEACARELGLDVRDVGDVLSGECDRAALDGLIDRISRHYPVDRNDLVLQRDECVDGVKIMRAGESEASRRTFDRPGRSGVRTPYYEYRDTAMTRMSPINPEWIKQLRVVDDDDPRNPDVAYNNGHFLHQLTFFLGPVNFYYEVDGKRHCVRMNTGDSNYITPFFKHSFASRDADATALIVAVTFGADVRRAQRELCAMGRRGLNYRMESRSPGRRASVQLIRQHMRSEHMTEQHLRDCSAAIDPSIDVDALLDERADVSHEQLRGLARVLNVGVHDLMMPTCAPGDDVLVKHRSVREGYWYPNGSDRRYRIDRLVRSAMMPRVKGFNLTVLQEEPSVDADFKHALHSYVYNYGDNAVGLHWYGERSQRSDELAPGDSLYISPFVRHTFTALRGDPGKLLAVSVGGAMNLEAQREYSRFADGNRVVHESGQWFD